MSIRWEEPTVPSVRWLIKHPGYAGAYVYGKKHWRRVQAGGEPAPEGRLVGQFVEQWDHHEGYITKEEYLENQTILALNAKGPNRGQLGPGPALLQGRCSCARHGAMAVHYNRGVRNRGWSFQCLGDYLVGGDQCVSVPGPQLEQSVVAAVLDAIDVPVIEEAHRLWRAAQREWGQQHHGLQVELDRKLQSQGQVKQRLLEQDRMSHPRLRAMFEDEYEKTAAEVERLRQRIAREEIEVDPFTEQRWAELKGLCGDVKQIWHASTTTNHDRKQLVRLLVHRLMIDKVEPERVESHIVWADGRAPTRIELLRAPYFHRLMWELAVEGLTVESIVERFAAMGARTQQGNPWSLATVQKTLAILVKRALVSENATDRKALPVRLQPSQVMMEMYTTGFGAEEIANRLNAMGLLTRYRGLWSASSVHRVLQRLRSTSVRHS